MAPRPLVTQSPPDPYDWELDEDLTDDLGPASLRDRLIMWLIIAAALLLGLWMLPP